jgi:hypothetical protein
MGDVTSWKDTVVERLAGASTTPTTDGGSCIALPSIVDAMFADCKVIAAEHQIDFLPTYASYL